MQNNEKMEHFLQTFPQLKEFTGSMEAVLEVHNAAMLKKMIKFVSVRASQVASKSSNVGNSGAEADDGMKQQELNESLQEFISEEAAVAPNMSDEDW